MGSILSTVGLEIEGVTRTIDSINEKLVGDPQLRGLIGSVTHDASVEGEVRYHGRRGHMLYLGSSLVRSSQSLRNLDRNVAGFEAVSNPLSADFFDPQSEIQRFVILTMNHLVKAGEIFSPRSSIHVHVGFPRDYIFSKSVLSVGKFVEPLLYKLAGMGRPYRGSINDSAFARSFSCPPLVRLEDGKFAQISPDKSLDSRNIEEFWDFMGVRYFEPQRYHPARYFGINVLSQLLRGTVEFRFFNYTHNPAHIIAVSNLCQTIAELMVRVPHTYFNNVDSLSIFKQNQNIEYHVLLERIVQLSEKFACIYKITSPNIEILHGLVESTPQPVFSGEPSITHLERYHMRRSWAEKNELRIFDTAKESGVLNIHNFNQSDRSLV